MRPGGADHQRVNRFLAHARPSRALAHREAAGPLRERDRFRADERVEEHQIGAAQAGECRASEQLGITGTRADEGDKA